MLFNQTIQALQFFGPNAAGILNAYCIELEDALFAANVSDAVLAGVRCQLDHFKEEVFAAPSNNIRPCRLAG